MLLHVMSNSYMYIYNMANAEEATLKHIELKHLQVSFSTVVDVLGLEQFKLGHDNGGSQDHSRIM